jgi:Skp family chaperone for outer membrane proteins
MLGLHRTGVLLVCAVVAAGLVGSGTWAAALEPKVGVVDGRKIDDNAPRVKQYMEELDAMANLLKTKLDIRAQNTMLDENEINELISLKTKDKATDADTARIKALTDIERSKDEELRKLQETKDLNEQQKARLQELMNLQQKSKDMGNALSKDYDGQYQSKAVELQGKIDTDVRAAVAKVAEAKGLSLVFDKSVVVYGGIDITDDVVARLDRKME